jgi:hypothetical protein
MRCIVPDIAISWVRQRVERRYLQHRPYPDVPDRKTVANLKSLPHRNRRARYSILIPALSITLRQRSSSPRK